MIPAPPERIYSAWLDAASHSAFTGEEATFEPFVGGRHTSFGGYSEGTNLELLPGRRIVQTWRAKDFPEGSPDSRLEVTLEETLGGTVVTILHSELPSGQAERYRDGWVKFYLEPLKQFFAADDSQDAAASAEAEDEGDTEDEDTVSEGPVPPVAAPAPARKPAKARPAATAPVKAAARRSGASSRASGKTVKPAAKKTSAARRAAAPKGGGKAKAMKAKGGKAKPKAKARKASSGAAKKAPAARGGKKRGRKK